MQNLRHTADTAPFDLRSLLDRLTARLNASRIAGVRNPAAPILAHRAITDLLTYPNMPARGRVRVVRALDEALAVLSRA